MWSQVAQHYAQSSTNMSEDKLKLESMVLEASGIHAASNGKVGIAQAMGLVGFSQDDIKKMSIYQKVRRKAQKVMVVEVAKTPLPGSVNLSSSDSQVSALSSDERLLGKRKAAAERSNRRVRRRLLETPSPEGLLTEASIVSTVGTGSTASKEKQSRRTPKELQRSYSMVVMQSNRDKEAMKQATLLIKRNQCLPSNERKTIADIVDATNELMDANISAKTAARYVRNGHINASPLKRGPVGPFPTPIYNALKGAFVTYLKLEQSESKKQSTIKSMSKLVNACVNKGGHEKVRDDLTRKLKRDTADQFTLSKSNVVEARRLMWTTSYNLNAWFDSWKKTLIELGFGREKQPEETNVQGEVVFFEGQLNRILNFDETDGSLDDTKGQRGGRPAMSFFSPDIAGGGTSVNKSGYSSTVICGSTAAGEPLPPHFQLKTLAQTADKERISVDWIRNSKNVVGQYGFQEPEARPCTFGMNERGGMNAVELDKYFKGSVLPLYPDVEDKPLKRVIIKADSGPGRMNIEMLADLQLRGVYLVPGVPNTTGKTQETDQNYGIYKSSFRQNLRELTQARHQLNVGLKVSDLPLLVFGGKCRQTSIDLRDSFTDAFSVERNLACWRKCGAVPLTRAPLLTDDIREEIPVGIAAQIEGCNVTPQMEKLKQLEALNHLYCSFLSSQGFDGDQLRRDAPQRITYVAVTEPHSKERILAIQKAKTAGQMFFATGGRHVNSNEFFQATTLRAREGQIKAMEDTKLQRAKYAVDQRDAHMMIKTKGELTSINAKHFTSAEIKTLLRWKRKKPAGTKKKDLVEAYITTPKPPIQKSWTRSEEEALLQLKSTDVSLKDTALGVATIQMARAVGTNLAKVDSPTRAALKQSLLEYEEAKAPNCL